MSSPMVESLNQALGPQVNDDPYYHLPECIRQYYSRAEWLFLSDEQKANLEQYETEPEC